MLMQVSKTLYSLDKQNNVIQWTITYDSQSNWYSTASGRLNGAQTETKKTFCFGKNKGRSNETSDNEQMLLEVNSKIDKQYKRGFQDDIPTTKRFEVTLAKEFKARKKFIKFPMLLSCKIDGFRCYITKDGMFSRTHHKILSCPHIFEEVKELFDVFDGLVLDGELYSHELRDNFNQVASLLSRTKNLDEDFLNKTKSIIKLHLFDITQLSNPLPYKERCDFAGIMSKDKNGPFLSPLITENDKFDYVNIVHQFEVNSFEEVESMLDRAINEGFEGIMLRNPDMYYDNGRSSNLIKYKRFLDSEYKIVEICDGVGNASGLASTIICESLENGLQFKVGLGKGWNEDKKRDLYLNREKYEGQMGTIVYQALTPDGVPRFGKLLRLRTDI